MEAKPSQPVLVRLCNYRHSGGLGWCARVSIPQFPHIQSVGSEDPIEVSIRARDHLARHVGVLDVEIAEGEQAALFAQPLPRHGVTGALDQVVEIFGVADHLVPPLFSGGPVVSAGYALKSGPC